MQINKITGVSAYPKTRYNKTNSVQTEGVSFKSYESIMKNAYSIDIKQRSSVISNFRKIYNVLLKERGITISPAMRKIQRHFDFADDSIQSFLDEICKPVSQVKSDLRDIVYDSRERDIPLIQKGYSTLLYIENNGKHGFFNRMFDSESARNDIRVTLESGDYRYQVGLTGDKWLKLRKEWANDWDESVYWLFERQSHRSGSSFPGHVVFTP